MAKLKHYLFSITVAGLLIACAALYLNWRRAEAAYVAAVTSKIKSVALLNKALREARRVRKIDPPDTVVDVVDAGAEVSAKVAARVVTRGESGGDAAVEKAVESKPGVEATTVLSVSDEHGRFNALLELRFNAGRFGVGKPQWSVYQIFNIETVEVSQRYEDETLYRGYTVTLSEESPRTGEEIGRWTARKEDVVAEYVPAKRRRRWALFTEGGFSYSDGDPSFYGLGGLRVGRWQAAAEVTEDALGWRAGWRREW
jgi:hypothetical protein